MTHSTIAGDSHASSDLLAGDAPMADVAGAFDKPAARCAGNSFAPCTPGVFDEVETVAAGDLGAAGGQVVVAADAAGDSVDAHGELETALTLETAAAQIESMMPRIARRLFTVYPNDPAGELPNAQLRMCSFLQHGPSPITSIADELSISVSAATQLADRLEKTGMVERTGDTSDRRVRLVSLTSHGIEVMRSRQERRRSQVRHVLTRLSEDERNVLVGALEKLLNAAIEEQAELNSSHD